MHAERLVFSGCPCWRGVGNPCWLQASRFIQVTVCSSVLLYSKQCGGLLNRVGVECLLGEGVIK